jgi:hypothetical protein
VLRLPLICPPTPHICSQGEISKTLNCRHNSANVITATGYLSQLQGRSVNVTLPLAVINRGQTIKHVSSLQLFRFMSVLRLNGSFVYSINSAVSQVPLHFLWHTCWTKWRWDGLCSENLCFSPVSIIPPMLFSTFIHQIQTLYSPRWCQDTMFSPFGAGIFF